MSGIFVFCPSTSRSLWTCQSPGLTGGAVWACAAPYTNATKPMRISEPTTTGRMTYLLERIVSSA